MCGLDALADRGLNLEVNDALLLAVSGLRVISQVDNSSGKSLSMLGGLVPVPVEVGVMEVTDVAFTICIILGCSAAENLDFFGLFASTVIRIPHR